MDRYENFDRVTRDALEWSLESLGLRRDLDHYLDESIERQRRGTAKDPEQTIAFRRVLQTAILHVQSAQRSIHQRRSVSEDERPNCQRGRNREETSVIDEIFIHSHTQNREFFNRYRGFDFFQARQ